MADKIFGVRVERRVVHETVVEVRASNIDDARSLAARRAKEQERAIAWEMAPDHVRFEPDYTPYTVETWQAEFRPSIRGTECVRVRRVGKSGGAWLTIDGLHKRVKSWLPVSLGLARDESLHPLVHWLYPGTLDALRATALEAGCEVGGSDLAMLLTFKSNKPRFEGAWHSQKQRHGVLVTLPSEDKGDDVIEVG